MFTYMVENADQMLLLTKDHLYMTAVSVALAILIAVPSGILATRGRRVSFWVISAGNLGQTVPSLALLGLLMPVFGIGLPVAIAALTIRAILPILINTCAGISGVDRAVIEAARGMGMSSRQILTHIQLPLALPLILAGIRTATAHCVSIATMAAFVGAGGLGELIFQGVWSGRAVYLLAGAVPAAVLAIGLDWLLGRAQLRLTARTAG